MCEPRTATVPGSAQLHIQYWKTDAIFRFKNPTGRIVRLNLATGPSDSPIRFYPVRFCNSIGLHKKTDLFFRLKSKNLKLGIGSHEQPCFEVKLWRCEVDVPNLPKCPVPASMSYQYRYQLPYDVRTSTGSTGGVPVLMSYETYGRVRYRY